MRTLTIEEARVVAGSGPGWDTADSAGKTMQDDGKYIMQTGGPTSPVGMSLYGYGLALSAVAEANGGYGPSYSNLSGSAGGGGGGGGGSGYPPAGGGGGSHHTTCTPGYDSTSWDGHTLTSTHHNGQCVSTN